MTPEEFKTKDRFPDPWLDEISTTDGFIILETERIRKDGKFVECSIVNKRTYLS